ncbi:MAG: leucine-rich repeat protein [Clostridia bacterium]|nr:leucine-rich repeat protein [Clostridia bacterium]
MKKTLTLSLALCLLLTGCSNTPSESGGTETESTTSTDAVSPSAQIAIDAAELRAAYYQQLVSNLQQEILTLKSEFERDRNEYESRIDELEASMNPATEEESSFQFTTADGKATITAYIGSNKEVQIPETLGGCPVTVIADRAFENHADLTSVTLPEGVTDIGWFAFSGCVSLTRVQMPKSVATISYGAFENCNSALTFLCVSDSYAEQYARSYGIGVEH